MTFKITSLGLAFIGMISLSTCSVPILSHQAPTGQHYDQDCCSDNDCALLTSLEHEVNKEGQLTGWVFVTNALGLKGKAELSRVRIKRATDGHDHVCISKISSTVFCFYLGDGS